eukprot:5787070-Pyramimonas_sp.AAC.1
MYKGSSPWERESNVIREGPWHWERDAREIYEESWPQERAPVVICKGSLPWGRESRVSYEGRLILRKWFGAEDRSLSERTSQCRKVFASAQERGGGPFGQPPRGASRPWGRGRSA